ncbi:MAG: hypothetical protein H6818_00360 [Phycisphaerales bacterium]|nr:hypothetical protein [Phycisphaerales bacterium]
MSIRTEPDASHTIKVTDRDGKPWYREAAPAVDMRHIQFNESWVLGPDREFGYMISIHVRPEYRDRMRMWTRAHMEDEVGVFIGGKLHHHETLHAVISGMFVVSGFETLDEAQATCARIRSGGDPSLVEGELSRIREQHAQQEEEERNRAKRPLEDIAPPMSFEFVSVRLRPDDTHKRVAGTFRGVKWYREIAPGLDEPQCRFVRNFGAAPAGDTIQTIVRPENVASFAEWWRQHADTTIGYIVDGELQTVSVLPGRPADGPGPLAWLFRVGRQDSDTKVTSAPSVNPDDELQIEISQKAIPVAAMDYPYGDFSLTAVREKSNAEFSCPLTDGEGTTWFGSTTDFVLLSGKDPLDAVVTGGLDGDYHLCLPVTPKAQVQLRDFCRRHAGERAGIVLTDFPLIVRTLQGPPPERIEIATYTNHRAALRARDLLRRGRSPVWPALTDEQAKARIAKWYADSGKVVPPDLADAEVEEPTFSEIHDRERIEGQLVKLGLQAFLIHGDEVIKLGESFGGMGFQDSCVSDLDEDGHPELLFTYSYGSGIHRSQVGAWCDAWPKPRVIQSDCAFRGQPDFTLRRFSDQHVLVMVGTTRVGRLVLVKTDHEPQLRIELSPNLPESIRSQLWDLNSPTLDRPSQDPQP